MKNRLDNLSEQPSCSIFDASKKTAQLLMDDDRLITFKKSFFTKSERVSQYETRYFGSDELTQGCGELTVLCGRALLNCVAKYPYRSKYVLINASPFNPFFYFGLAGLVRRILIGKKDPNARVAFLGTYNFGALMPRVFLLFQNPNAKVTNHYSVSAEIGYKGFLEHLKNTKKKYVVLRFFENLPKGNRIGGDLDILVEDGLQEEASEFLTKNPGTQMVDMYSVSGPSNAARIPYHTPFLSRQILENATTFRGYRVPNDVDYFHSFIYHCLYHKGLSSGIPSCYQNLVVSSSPDNDYLGKIKELGANVGVVAGESLEELDLYMETVGWKPHADTLDLLSSSNKWIYQHLKSLELAEEITLTVCVLKSGFRAHHSVDEFKSSLNAIGFEVLIHEHLLGDRANLAYDHLRGGNWSASNAEEYSPSDIYVIFDKTRDGVLVR